ncbi:hypothetical protein C3K47_11480 [Solitalea longa]|uniref:Outer membrane protein beta-barrel domain-containing protein n=1 Tax=Solitalea longa TaxID=2079460 RepID=A0A2S5A1A2_9SPHI|nr:DUF6048 family protein [Solitalea longa]POY36361.1 hypothetical protein C3K47_11480 [Solitalea longa]
MKAKLLLGFILSSFCLMHSTRGWAQDTSSVRIKKDTVSYLLPKALTLGIDISYPIRYAFNKDEKVFEVVADFRFNNNWYAAVEAGYADASQENSYISYNTKGGYLKLGANRNLIKFQKASNNSVYAGARAVISVLNTDVYNYTINQKDWPGDVSGSFTDNSTVYSLELLLGIKVELLKNFFTGWSIRGGFPIVNKATTDGYENLYIPGLGFKKNFMFNFNYTLSYMLPMGKAKSKTGTVENVK